METESPLPKKQEKDASKDSEGSLSTCSSNQEAFTASIAKAEEKPTNAERTVEQSPAPSSPEKEAGENPSKEGKCENVPSPEKTALSSGSPTAAPQAAAVSPASSTGTLQAPAVPPAATNSAPQAAVPPAATNSVPQAAEVPPAATDSAPQTAEVPPAATNSTSQAAAAVSVTPTKSTPQVASVLPAAAKSTVQAAAVPVTATKSTTQTSAVLLSSKTQVSGLPSVSKSSTQAGPSLLLAPKGSAQAGTSLLLAPKSGTQVGSSLLLASKGTAKAGSSLLASKSSAEVAASLLAARSGAQQGASLLTSKSSAQAAASLLAARSGAQQGPSRSGAQAAKSSQLASKSGSQASEGPAKALCKPLTSEDAKERQPFFNRLYKAVAWKLVAVGGFSPNVNHAELLNSSIQSVKATLDVAFVPLKELADLPQNKSSLENIVCELRCKSVYLGTGCGKNMENAKAVASREALKLFLKKKVIVKICKRKYKGSEIEDLVLLDEESKPSNLPPALLNPREII